MSSEGVGHVWRYSPYSGATLLVHLAIGDSVNDQNGNEVWMAMGTLAAKARVERRTAGRAVKQLISDGWLVPLEESAGKTNHYRFMFLTPAVVYETRYTPSATPQPGSREPTPTPGTVTQGVGRENPGGGSREPRGWVERTQGVGRENPQTQKNPRRTQEEQPPLSPDGDETAATIGLFRPPPADPLEGFDVFWDAYPARNGKRLHRRECEEMWKRMDLPTKRSAARGARHYGDAYRAGLPGVGAMDPDRFLRHRRWEDWQTPAVPDTRPAPARGGSEPIENITARLRGQHPAGRRFGVIDGHAREVAR